MLSKGGKRPGPEETWCGKKTSSRERRGYFVKEIRKKIREEEHLPKARGGGKV